MPQKVRSRSQDRIAFSGENNFKFESKHALRNYCYYASLVTMWLATFN